MELFDISRRRMMQASRVIEAPAARL